jgi:hypothetical protein
MRFPREACSDDLNDATPGRTLGTQQLGLKLTPAFQLMASLILALSKVKANIFGFIAALVAGSVAFAHNSATS